MEAATTATHHYEDVAVYASAPNEKFYNLTPNNILRDFHTVGTEPSDNTTGKVRRRHTIRKASHVK